MGLTLLAGLLARWSGLRALLARVAPAIWIGVVVAAVVLGGALWLHRHDAAVLAAQAAKVARVEAPARDAAADARASDAVANVQEEEVYHDAIADARATGAPDPADVALACERLRRAGVALPAGC